jgi:hypothetical protein
VTAGWEVHLNFVYESACLMLITVHKSEVLKNVVLHVDVSFTSGIHSDIPFEAVLQEYLQLSLQVAYFPLVLLLFKVTVISFVPQTTPEEKSHKLSQFHVP